MILWCTARNRLAIGTLPALPAPEAPSDADSDDSDLIEPSGPRDTVDLGTVKVHHWLQLLPGEAIVQVRTLVPTVHLFRV